ncbi:MAG: RND transporter, partial [Clostridia bacterium]|nr:RND transporter [Clostridia bacterium]
NYQLIVPNSAMRSDSNGDFILIVEAKSTPLGTRYIARRTDVQVLDKDDTNTAVSGGLAGWEYVITTSSKPLNPGDQVRLVDQ